MKIRKELSHPIFLQCCQYTSDPFWKQIFENLSYGIPVYGSYMSGNSIISTLKGKEFNYRVTSQSPKEIYSDLKKIFKTKLSINSNIDRKRNVDKFNNEGCADDEKSSTIWSSIRKKNNKDFFIENFVIEMKNKHNLSMSQARKLLSLINVGLMFKTITTKHIKYSGERIESIKGIEFEEGKMYFYEKFTEPKL